MHDSSANGNVQTSVFVPAVAVSSSRSRRERLESFARQPLLFVAAAMAAGIVVDRYWPLSVTAWLIIAATARSSHGCFRCAERCPLSSRRPCHPAQACPPARVHHQQRSFRPSRLKQAFRSPYCFWRWRPVAARGTTCAGGCSRPMTSAGTLRELPQPVCLEVTAITGPRTRPAPSPDPLRSVPPSATGVLRVRAARCATAPPGARSAAAPQ